MEGGREGRKVWRWALITQINWRQGGERRREGWMDGFEWIRSIHVAFVAPLMTWAA
jgi:hypothetical protein